MKNRVMQGTRNTGRSSLRRQASYRLSGSALPVIGQWFPQESVIARRDGYREFLDAAAEHSHFTLVTTSMRDPYREIVDPAVHDWFKAAARYARAKGMELAIELDVRQSKTAFRKRYSDEMQERLWLQEFDLPATGEMVSELDYAKAFRHGDAICNNLEIQVVRLHRVYSYVRTPEGIDPASVKDITSMCRVNPPVHWADQFSSKMSVVLPSGSVHQGRKACVVSRVIMDIPDVFSPNVIPFERETIRQYADVSLAGLLKDEWGFPASFDGNPQKNAFWYSRFQADAYAKATRGRDLVRDSLLMWAGECGRERERQLAINHLMDLYRRRNTEIEEAYYRATKETFGPNAYIGTHDTTHPTPDCREFERNGLNWWSAPRDFAQSDEQTPYCCRTSMAKKFGSTVWYNQWYAPTADTYEKELWGYALAGGRMNFHPLFPSSRADLDTGLLRSKVAAIDCRIRLLNLISDAPVDCPVAVIFGHAAAMNWAGPAYDNIGMDITDALWRVGMYADLIPSSEIGGKALRVGRDGYIWFGRQRYAAVVLHQPEFEKPGTAKFFQKCAEGKTLLYRVGDWTRNYDGKSFAGNAALPARMQAIPDSASCAQSLLAELRRLGSEPQTPATQTYPLWHCSNPMGRAALRLPAAGRCRLTDGTMILASAEQNVLGDPIRETISVQGKPVTFDAMGLAAVRLDKDGKLAALAAAALKSFQGAGLTLRLATRVDVALWKNKAGEWQGVLQGGNQKVPADLAKITRNWTHVNVPPAIC